MVPGWDIREQLLKDNPGTMMTWSPIHQNWVIASTMTDKLNLSKKWGVILIENDKIKVTKKGKIKTTKIGYFFDCKKIV